jgi:hypothetical protein
MILLSSYDGLHAKIKIIIILCCDMCIWADKMQISYLSKKGQTPFDHRKSNQQLVCIIAISNVLTCISRVNLRLTLEIVYTSFMIRTCLSQTVADFGMLSS